MTSPSRFILMCTLLIHVQAIVRNGWIIASCHRNEQYLLNFFQGITFILYPFFGWMAEVHTGSIKIIRWSFGMGVISSVLIVVNGAVLILLPINVDNGQTATVISILVVITALIGLGMFEANAIQFGMDQMLEASSEQLSSFIHWYFWCTHVGPLAVFYIVVGLFFYEQDCMIETSGIYKMAGMVLLILWCFQASCICCGLIYTVCPKNYLQAVQTKRNSLKIILKVLKYSYQHKYPERRSAFTYWENDTPSRIDLGKEKYGGPFTYEQVEDVKTFFRLLLLILSLFGYHLLGEGYSLSYYIMNTFGCPTVTPFLLIIANPEHFLLLITFFGVPFLRGMKRFSNLVPNMLTRLLAGLIIALMAETLQIFYILIIEKKVFKCPELFAKQLTLDDPISKKCMFAVTNFVTANDKCSHFCSDVPINENLYIVYLSIIPFTLYGISYLLIFMTILEFICAQSPNSMKGLLIGIWYSMSSIKYTTINLLDIHSPLIETVPWSLYNGAKGFGIFLSICAFSVIYRHYRYRERNEVVNEQAIIEEQYERELLINNCSDSDSD